MSDRYLCIHGHFYQPPRENPWLEVIETQVTARPFHDWNEKIARECYGPNGRARVLDAEGRIARVVNNYEYMSFNFGPTLLSWLETFAPNTYARLLAADAASRKRNQGHGNALAQVYNHIIMPLANRRDRLTQIRWGLRDFLRRFGRPAEGMWLAETAVDRQTLALLADEGVRYTVLSPTQARRVRPLGGRGPAAKFTPEAFSRQALSPAARPDTGPAPDWEDVSGGRIDPRQPYRVFLDGAGEKFIDVFFYDGPTSQAVAYERLLSSGSSFLARIERAYGADTGRPRLVNLATDGESYGHHFQFGDMALAWVFDQVERRGDIQVVNYGQYLDLHPPEHEVEVIDNSSWSCAHGVERWRSDCGCHTGGQEGWTQAWRRPLRDGLDWLRDELAAFYVSRADGLLRDPWAARDDYISCLLAPEEKTRRAFLRRHAPGDPDEDAQVVIFTLLEMQLMSQYMFTSCGWFFDDIAGLEPVQDLKYAARAIELAETLGQSGLEDGLLDYLAQAPVNDPDYRDGAEVYRREVLPACMSPGRAAAHWVLNWLVNEENGRKCPAARLVEVDRKRNLTAPGLTAVVGRARVRDLRTGRAVPTSFLGLHQGGPNPVCLVDEGLELDLDAADKAIHSALDDASPERVLEAYDRLLPEGHRYELDDLIPDSRIRLVRAMAHDFFEQLRAWVLDNYPAHWEVLSLFRETGGEARYDEQFIFRTLINHRLQQLLAEGEKPGGLDLEALRALAAQARTWGVSPEEPAAAAQLTRLLERRFADLNKNASAAAVRELTGFISLLRRYDRNPDLWRSQNAYYDLSRNPEVIKLLDPEEKKDFARLGQALGFRIEEKES